MMAREAALNEIARSKLHRLLSRDKFFGCTDVKVGVSVNFV